MTARTLEGLEWILARELEQLGAQDLRIGRRTIEFSATPGAEKETLYRAVLESRTAIRVHKTPCPRKPCTLLASSSYSGRM